MIRDVHTHQVVSSDAVYNLASPDTVAPRHDVPVSVGLHPWNTSRADADDVVDAVECRAAADPQVVAIGETGLDKHRGAPLERQLELLMRHIDIAGRLQLPLILHVVGAWSEIIALKRRDTSGVPWIIHGFRGKPQLARQLADAGFYISIGSRYNADAVSVIPSDRLLVETDDSSTLPDMPATADASRLFDRKVK